MGKKDLEKNLKVWECKHGCDLSSKPCPHLEKLLPQPDQGRLPTHQTAGNPKYDIRNELQMLYTENDPNNARAKDFEEKTERLTQKLMSLGLDRWRVELILDRFVSGLSLKEIMVKYGYLSTSVVQYLLKQTVDDLRRQGSQIARKLWGDYE